MKAALWALCLSFPLIPACRFQRESVTSPRKTEYRELLEELNDAEEAAEESKRLLDRAALRFAVERIRHSTDGSEQNACIRAIALRKDREALEILMDILCWENADATRPVKPRPPLPGGVQYMCSNALEGWPLSAIVMMNLQGILDREDWPLPSQIIYSVEQKHLWLEWWDRRSGQIDEIEFR